MDIDTGLDRSLQQKVGDKSLAALLADPSRELPDTLTAITGGGGKHLYFSTIRDIPKSEGRVAKDIDVRGRGGYVILPPSNHASGEKYRWSDPSKPTAELPEWLAKLMMTGGEVDLLQYAPQPDELERLRQAAFARMPEDDVELLLTYIPADCDRDTWWKVGAAIWYELRDAGKEVWRAWSMKAPAKFSEGDFNKQWNSFEDKGIKAGTLVKIAKDHGFPGFDKSAANSPDILERYVFVRSIKRIVEVPTIVELDREQFDFTLGPMFEKGKPYDHVARNADFRRVETVTYWPGNLDLIVTDKFGSALNYWRPPELSASPGPVDPFLAHIDYLFPNVDQNGKPIEGRSLDGRILLFYLAHQVQRPGEKIHWAVLLEGDQGNGKSYFKEVMEIVLGERNVQVINADILQEKYTWWQRRAQLIVVEEMRTADRRELMDRLKTMITEKWCLIRDMWKPPYEQPNRFNLLFFTNHKDSLIIDNKDRRYCILKSSAPPHPKGNEYYSPLFAWTRRNGPALLHFLQNYDLAGFEAKAHAPMTAGKRALILQSMLPLDQFIHERVEAKDGAFRWDVMNPPLLVPILAKFNIRATPKDVRNAFERLGYTLLGRYRAEGDNKINLWAVRNAEVYREMSGAQLQQVWLSQVTGFGSNPNVKVAEFSDMYERQEPRNEQADFEEM